jgi:hypothetical protein
MMVGSVKEEQVFAKMHLFFYVSQQNLLIIV